MLRSISFFLLVISFLLYISAEWYQSQVIVMESWAYLFKDNELETNELNDTVSESTERARSQNSNDDHENDTSLGFSESELRVRNLAIEMFSGAIYGYDFSYAPPNSSRQIQEHWTFKPVAKIPFEDSQLIELERNILNGALRIFYRYNLIDQQVRLLQSWEENSKVLYSKGEGISLHDGKRNSTVLSSTDENDYTYSRIEALYDAIQSAIRNRIKDTLPTTTRVVHGRVRLASQPFFTDYVHYYRVRATVMLYISNTERYYEVF